MVKKSLADYVRSLINKGYDVSTIRNFLLKYGYSGREIDEAVKSSYGLTIRHEIHLSPATFFAIFLVVVSSIGLFSFFYFSPSKSYSKLLDLNLEPLKTTVVPGGTITYIKELSNLGSAKRYDVVIKQEILDKANRIITEKIETRAIETFGSTQTNLLIPEDTMPGDYTLNIRV